MNYMDYIKSTNAGPYNQISSPFNNIPQPSGLNTTIGVNSFELFSAITTMQMAISSMDVSYEIWASQGEISATFNTFDMQFKQLQLIMENYKTLMQTNVEAIRIINEEITETDMSMATKWQ